MIRRVGKTGAEKILRSGAAGRATINHARTSGGKWFARQLILVFPFQGSL
jgi:hypothetical protein